MLTKFIMSCHKATIVKCMNVKLHKIYNIIKNAFEIVVCKMAAILSREK